jgi:hypothetical protein
MGTESTNRQEEIGKRAAKANQRREAKKKLGDGNLYLSRSIGEWIVLRDSTGKFLGKIGIADLRGTRARLACQMIDEITVLREEIDGEDVDPRKNKKAA